MTTMSASEVDEFLSTPNRHAVLATNRPNGPPQVSPVWYLWEDGVIYVSIPEASAKRRNLERDPNVSVCVDGGREDVRAVMLYGRAELRGRDDPLTNEMGWRIVRAYYPSETEARAYYESIADTPSRLIALEPEKILSQDYRD